MDALASPRLASPRLASPSETQPCLFPLPTSNPAPPARRKVLAIDAQYAKRAAI